MAAGAHGHGYDTHQNTEIVSTERREQLILSMGYFQIIRHIEM